MTPGEIERQGREAARAGRRVSECPYSHGLNRKYWLKGYNLELEAICGR